MSPTPSRSAAINMFAQRALTPFVTPAYTILTADACPISGPHCLIAIPIPSKVSIIGAVGPLTNNRVGFGLAPGGFPTMPPSIASAPPEFIIEATSFAVSGDTALQST